MTVSKSIKDLVTEGLVYRRENQIDSSAKNVFLTEEGRILINKLVPVVEKIDSEFFKKIP